MAKDTIKVGDLELTPEQVAAIRSRGFLQSLPEEAKAAVRRTATARADPQVKSRLRKGDDVAFEMGGGTAEGTVVEMGKGDRARIRVRISKIKNPITVAIGYSNLSQILSK